MPLFIERWQNYEIDDELDFFIVEKIMKTTENSKGDIIIVSSEHDGGNKLDGLGGIGAILRFKLNY